MQVYQVAVYFLGIQKRIPKIRGYDITEIRVRYIITSYLCNTCWDPKNVHR